MKLYGINEFAARFPNALAGCIVLITLFFIGKKHFGQQFGWLWVICFGASIAPHFYFRTGLIDPIFNFFIFLSLYYSLFLFKIDASYKSIKWRKISLSALFCAFAILTKGPVALILIIGTLGLFFVLTKFRYLSTSIISSLFWLLLVTILSASWFVYETYIHGNTYVKEFIVYQIRLFQTQDAKHGGTLLFHPIALLLGCFPASIFMWNAFYKNNNLEQKFQSALFSMMLACLITVLVVFSLVQTKIIHYSSMDYYPISFFAAFGIQQLLQLKTKIQKWQYFFLILIGLLWGLVLVLVPYIANHKELIMPLIKDPNFLAQLELNIQWHTWASLFGIVFLIFYFIGIKLLLNHQIGQGFLLISIAILFLIQIIFYYYLPRIENMVQGELVSFCKSHQNDNADHVALYLKSYNIFYYSNIKPFINKEDSLKHLYYLYMPLERDVYIYTRTMDKTKTDTGNIRQLEYLYGKGGFEFYKRKK